MLDRATEVATAQAVDRRSSLRPGYRHPVAANGRVVVQPNRQADNHEREDEQRDNGSESPVVLGDLT
jgi:hypothetical protein